MKVLREVLVLVRYVVLLLLVLRLVIDVLLRPRSLYVMHGPLRWHYTHEVLDAAASAEVWRKQPAEEGCGGEQRGRRISVIARDLGTPGVFGVEW